MLRKQKLYPTHLLYQEIKLLPIAKLYLQKVLNYTYQNDSIKLITHCYETRAKQQKMAESIKMKTSFGKNSFIYIAPKIYNKFNFYLNSNQINLNSRNIKSTIKNWIISLPWTMVQELFN